MSTLIKSLMGLITPELITNASALLGEQEEKVSHAVESTVASVLGGLLNKGASPEIEAVFNMAANNDLISDITNNFGGNLNEVATKVGGNLASTLFGDKFGAITEMIATQTGISKLSSGKIFSMIAPMISGFFGNQLKSGMNINSLMSELTASKASFIDLIPKDLTKTLGISALTGAIPSMANTHKMEDKLGEKIRKVNNTTTKAYETTVDDIKQLGFPIWKVLVPLVVALGLITVFFTGRSTPQKIEATKTPIEQHANNLQQQGTQTLNAINTKIDQVEEQSEQLSQAITQKITDTKNTLDQLIAVQLPDGPVLQGFKFGIEERIVDFIQSDDYLLMSNDELKTIWFDFDNINFEFGSGSKITQDSEVQIKNIAEILKHFGDVTVKLGAYTDRKGDETLNLKLSEARATTIKSLLIEAGVSKAQIIGAEGYGAKFATVSATASDAERAKDRRVALRFERKQ